MRKRLTAFFVTVSLILSLLTTMALAAGPTLTVKTPETIPKAGEEFTVTVEISGNPGLSAVQFTLAYDKEAMTCHRVSLGTMFNGTFNATNPEAVDGARVVAATLDAIDGDGVLAAFRFTAKKDNADLSSLVLTNLVLNDTTRGDVSAEIGRKAEDTSKVPEMPEIPSLPDTPLIPASQSAPTPSGGTAETAARSFPDAIGHWGEAWIVKAAERGLFGGDDKGNFRPDDNISRGDFVLVLWRMAGKPEPKGAAPFADVPTGNAYANEVAKAVAWASEQGYVNGKGNGFAPKDSLTRQEAMKILFGYAGGVSGMEMMLGSAYDSQFNDTGEIASWAKSAMYWAVYNKIINGMNGGLNPKGTATRAQLAKILVEYQNEIESKT